MASRRVHPTIDEETFNLLAKYGLNPRTALEQHACFLATNSTRTMLEETMLKNKLDELCDERKKMKSDLEEMDKRIEKVKMKLENIHEIKRNHEVVECKEFDECLHTIIARIGAIITLEEQGKWDLKKVPFKEIQQKCVYYRVPVEAVMERVPDAMKKYIRGYVSPTVTPKKK